MADAPKHQPPDEQMRMVWILTIALIICLAAGTGFSWIALKLATPPGAPLHPQAPSPAETHVFPEPRLQASPPAELNSLQEDENRLLSTYEWVDKPAGFARVPVERARVLFLERGVAVRGAETRGGR